MPAHHFSASKSALVNLCAWWARPDAPRVPYRKRRDALVGIAVHYALAHTLTTGDIECAFETRKNPTDELSDTEREEVLATHSAWLTQWYELNLDKGWRAEVACGLDPVRNVTRILETKEHRDYAALGEECVPGTADLVRYVAATRTVYVTDYKAGNGYDLSAKPAAENKQLHTLAASFAAHFGATSAVVAIAKVRPNGVRVDEAVLTFLDLEEHRQWLANTLEAIPTAEPVEGDHCYALFCDHYGSCPATRGALARVEPSAAVLDDRHHLPIVDDPLSIQSAAHARYQYETLRAAQAAIDNRMAACWNAVRQWADDHDGVPLENSVWKRVQQNRESIDLTVVGATNALEHAFGPVWRNAVEMSTSKKLIEDTARGIAVERTKAGEKITIKAVKDVALMALRAVGAVKSSSIVRYEECERDETALPISKE